MEHDRAPLVLVRLDDDLLAVRVHDGEHAARLQAAHTGNATFISVVTPIRANEFERMVAARNLSLTLAGLPEPNRQTGIITRWRDGEAYGFLVDGDQKTWFISRNGGNSSSNSITELAYGVAVSFSGSPHPTNGRRYPTAFSVRPLT